jgi:mRNA-degrading endonuclease HigB of HigAB toxin-antitoxin module
MSKIEKIGNQISNGHINNTQYSKPAVGSGHFAIQMKFFNDSKYQFELNGNELSYFIGDNIYAYLISDCFDLGHIAFNLDLKSVFPNNKMVYRITHSIHQCVGIDNNIIRKQFFNDSKYQFELNGNELSYFIGDNIYVKVQTSLYDYDVKMRLSDCYTKPSRGIFKLFFRTLIIFLVR